MLRPVYTNLRRAMSMLILTLRNITVPSRHFALRYASLPPHYLSQLYPAIPLPHTALLCRRITQLCRRITSLNCAIFTLSHQALPQLCGTQLCRRFAQLHFAFTSHTLLRLRFTSLYKAIASLYFANASHLYWLLDIAKTLRYIAIAKLRFALPKLRRTHLRHRFASHCETSTLLSISTPSLRFRSPFGRLPPM